MKAISSHLRKEGIFKTEISIGDTPSCSLVDKFSGIDEIRPGNFVFYDVMQFFLGSCQENEIAVALACPIVAKYPGRNEVVVYGGAVHLSKDCIEDAEGRKIFGLVSDMLEADFGPILKQTYVSSLSQEHGIIRSKNPYLQQKQVGDILLIYPIHSCLTANLMRQYTTMEGETIKTLNS
jgi:D-serine deaminase-like pyridoxal phosphate-dependent protein